MKNKGVKWLSILCGIVACCGLTACDTGETSSSNSGSEELHSVESSHIHKESDWVVDVMPTLNTVGSKHTYCLVCNENMQTVVIEQQKLLPLNYEVGADGISCTVTGIGADRDYTEIYIPETLDGYTVKAIRYNAFYNCGNLTSVFIPSSVTSIGAEAFGSCSSLTNIEVDKNNTAYQSIDGNLYTKDGKILIQYAIGKTATSFTIPDGVISVGVYAFSGCSSLTSVVIPDSVTDIESPAFYGCNSLINIEVSENNSAYQSIDGNLYVKDGKALIRYTIGKTITSFAIPEGVTSIGVWAFGYCSSLTSVEIPRGVRSIGECALAYCNNLTSITFHGTVEEWNAISKGSAWKYNISATKVVCTDGTVSI